MHRRQINSDTARISRMLTKIICHVTSEMSNFATGREFVSRSALISRYAIKIHRIYYRIINPRVVSSLCAANVQRFRADWLPALSDDRDYLRDLFYSKFHS